MSRLQSSKSLRSSLDAISGPYLVVRDLEPIPGATPEELLRKLEQQQAQDFQMYGAMVFGWVYPGLSELQEQVNTRRNQMTKAEFQDFETRVVQVRATRITKSNIADLAHSYGFPLTNNETQITVPTATGTVTPSLGWYLVVLDRNLFEALPEYQFNAKYQEPQTGGEDSTEEILDAEVTLEEIGTNPYSVKNIYADKYIVNNYYGSDKESE